MKKIKNIVIATVVLVALAIGLATHTLYTLGACAFIVGIANIVKMVRTR